MTTRAKQILNELENFSRYEPGKAIKNAKGKDIPGSTAIATNANVHYDPDVIHGGHFLQRYDLNDKLENFKLTHENALFLMQHLQKYVPQHDKATGVTNKKKVDKNGKII